MALHFSICRQLPQLPKLSTSSLNRRPHSDANSPPEKAQWKKANKIQLSAKAQLKTGDIGSVEETVAAFPAAYRSPLANTIPGLPFDGLPLFPEVEEDATLLHGANGEDLDAPAEPWSSDESLAVHAEHMFKNSKELIDYKEGRHASYEYGRYGNPTTQVLEEKMSALERAESTLFVSSGMYAIVAVLSTLVPPGGHIVTTTECYSETRNFIQNELSKLGITVTLIDVGDMDALRRTLDQKKVTLFHAESPTNPLLQCIDIKSVSKLCHRQGALVCIDSTLASPVNQKPRTLGADVVLHSATKYITGHSDVIGGCISGPENLVSKIRTFHHMVGGVINPNAAYMINRGMKTLDLRLQKQNSTALKMAQFLEKHPKIERVYYPGLRSSPEHRIAKRQMTGFGGVVSFEVAGDLETTMKFIDALKIPYLATSFGGCESLVQQPAVISYWESSPSEKARYGIKDNLVRFSFGIESFEELKSDIVQALEMI